jgi:hypothetical protein
MGNEFSLFSIAIILFGTAIHSAVFAIIGTIIFRLAVKLIAKQEISFASGYLPIYIAAFISYSSLILVDLNNTYFKIQYFGIIPGLITIAAHYFAINYLLKVSLIKRVLITFIVILSYVSIFYLFLAIAWLFDYFKITRLILG